VFLAVTAYPRRRRAAQVRSRAAQVGREEAVAVAMVAVQERETETKFSRPFAKRGTVS
jgi:hypothetical protein